MWQKYLLLNELPQKKGSSKEKSLWMLPLENLYACSVHRQLVKSVGQF